MAELVVMAAVDSASWSVPSLGVVLLAVAWYLRRSIVVKQTSKRAWKKVTASVDTHNEMQDFLEQSLLRSKAEAARNALFPPLFTRCWIDVDLYDLTPAEEAESCRRAIEDSIWPEAFPQIVDLYLNYASVLAVDPPKRDRGLSVKSLLPASSQGESWSVHMTRRSWVRFCGRLHGVDEARALGLWKSINRAHNQAFQDTKLEYSRRPMLIYDQHLGGQSQDLELKLRLKAESALTTDSFSLSEFIEAIIRLGCTHDGRRPQLPSASEAASAVTSFLSTVITPHRAQLGLADFRAAMSSSPALNKMLLELTPLHADIYHRFAVVAAAEKGVSLKHFLELSTLVAPMVPHARATAAFIESLPLDQLYSSESAKLLGPQLFQEAVLRLCILGIDIDTHPDSAASLSGAELATSATKMTVQQVATVRAAMEAMRVSAFKEPKKKKSATDALSLAVRESAAAVMIERRHRGNAVRQAVQVQVTASP